MPTLRRLRNVSTPRPRPEGFCVARYEWFTGRSGLPALYDRSLTWHIADSLDLPVCGTKAVPRRATPIWEYGRMVRRCLMCRYCLAIIERTDKMPAPPTDVRPPTEDEYVWIVRYDTTICAVQGYTIPGKKQYVFRDVITGKVCVTNNNDRQSRLHTTYESARAAVKGNLTRRISRLEKELSTTQVLLDRLETQTTAETLIAATRELMKSAGRPLELDD